MADTTPAPGDDFEDGLPDDGLAAGTFDRLPEPPPVEEGYPTLSWEVLPPARPAPARRSIWRPIALVIVAALAGAGAALAVSLALQDPSAPPGVTVVERVETQLVTPSGELTAVAAVARQVVPSIVTVEVSLGGGDEFVADASGSGVVYDPIGHIVTNSHVVQDAVALRVVFADGRTYDAELIGRDPLTDVAVLRVAAVGLTPILIGSSRDLSIGDQAIAVGSPLGLEGGPSVTTGVLSAFDRRVRTVNSELFGMLQTDAPITRGSSGGALVDGAGRLIGITTAFGVSDVGAEGLGFAIPVELVMRVADDIIETGVASHAFLGISGSTHFETLADGALAPAGVEVAGVIPGTAADLGGIDSGDIILTVGGEPVTTLDGLVIRLRFFRVGDSVVVQVLRGVDAVAISIVLLERPADL
jgi:S1-C subfamily serine protease